LGPNWRLLLDGEFATASLVEDYGAHFVKSSASVGTERENAYLNQDRKERYQKYT
jgi:hypothetical protein